MKRTKTNTRYSCISEALNGASGEHREFIESRMAEYTKNPEQAASSHVTERPEFMEAVEAMGSRRRVRTKKAVS